MKPAYLLAVLLLVHILNFVDRNILAIVAGDIKQEMGLFLNNMYVGSLWSLTQSLVAPRMRAVAAATQLAVLNFAGLFVGPLIVGSLNDALTPRLGASAVRWSLLAMAVVGASAAIFFRSCARTLREDLVRG